MYYSRQICIAENQRIYVLWNLLELMALLRSFCCIACLSDPFFCFVTAKCIYGGKVLAEGQRILTKTCRECRVSFNLNFQMIGVMTDSYVGFNRVLEWSILAWVGAWGVGLSVVGWRSRWGVPSHCHCAVSLWIFVDQAAWGKAIQGRVWEGEGC